jgi:hypothetical protein
MRLSSPRAAHTPADTRAAAMPPAGEPVRKGSKPGAKEPESPKIGAAGGRPRLPDEIPGVGGPSCAAPQGAALRAHCSKLAGLRQGGCGCSAPQAASCA